MDSMPSFIDCLIMTHFFQLACQERLGGGSRDCNHEGVWTKECVVPEYGNYLRNEACIRKTPRSQQDTKSVSMSSCRLVA